MIKRTERVLHVTCTDNDGMENQSQDQGVVFKVAKKRRDAGYHFFSHFGSEGGCAFWGLGMQGIERAGVEEKGGTRREMKRRGMRDSLHKLVHYKDWPLNLFCAR